MNKEKQIKYNDELLNYVGISKNNSEFAKKMNITSSSLVIFIMIISICMIYTLLKIIYQNRSRELGELQAIGMNKKQEKQMINKEGIILGGIGIVTGLTIGLGISAGLAYLINMLLQNYMFDIENLKLITIKTEFYMKCPVIIMLLIIAIIYIIIFIAIKLSIRQINNQKIIERIKNVKKIKAKYLKTPKYIEQYFREEGVVGYKNIKRDKEGYRAIVSSLVISIILFLSVSGVINNYYKTEFNEYIETINGNFDDYTISLNDGEKVGNVVQYLKDNNLMYNYCICKLTIGDKLRINAEDMTQDIRKLIKNRIIDTNTNGELELNITTFNYDKEAYNTILKKAGIVELKDKEAIIINTINEKTKFGKNTI